MKALEEKNIGRPSTYVNRSLIGKTVEVLRLLRSKTDLLKFDGLEINIAARTVAVDGSRVELTPKEYDLLFYLIENKNIALSRDKLLADIWGYDFLSGYENGRQRTTGLQRRI